ncbi:hypothetical protein SDC9_199336 [bioreactor metagenome]|uniref:Uncharacterized protein n=1 Tax=bioreactor metagenome TaxID=1076179 RepID=A0A645IKA5_9ZZZZ
MPYPAFSLNPLEHSGVLQGLLVPPNRPRQQTMGLLVAAHQRLAGELIGVDARPAGHLVVEGGVVDSPIALSGVGMEHR